MKYFNNIKSLSELKKQFRTLALANHPDKGGETKTMQEINSEFDILFTIWSQKPESNNNSETKETATQYRRNFYTEYGWQGVRYDRDLSTKEIAARVREYGKNQWPQYKFSIRTEYFAGGSAIHLALVSGPEAAFLEGTEENEKGYITIHRNFDRIEGMTEIVKHVINDMNDFMDSYNYDDSDSMIDYFSTNFYTHVSVGKWDKPYEIKKDKQARIEKNKTVQTIQTPVSITNNDLIIVDYSEKAIALFGDTRNIKDELNDIGGRFNYSLTYKDQKQAGWIFSKKKAPSVKSLLSKFQTLEKDRK